MSALAEILNLRERMGRNIIGQEQVVERLLLALLSNGSVLMEGLPGLAKTRAVKGLAADDLTNFRGPRLALGCSRRSVSGNCVRVDPADPSSQPRCRSSGTVAPPALREGRVLGVIAPQPVLPSGGKTR